MTVKERIFLITSLLYILYTIFPLFADSLSIPTWLPSIAAVSIMIVLYPQAYLNNKTFVWFLVYSALLLLYLLAGRPLSIGIGTVADSKKILIEFAYILPSISIMSILVYLKDEDLNRKLLKWSTTILYLSFIVAIPLMLTYNSLREALSEVDQERIIAPGLPGYGLMHAYTLFLPVLCYCVKVFKGKRRLFSIIGLMVMCFVIYDTFVTTSLILMIVVLIFTIFYSNKSQHMSLFIMSVVAILFFVLYEIGFFVSFIDWAMPAFEGTAVEPKLIDMRDSMTQGHVMGGSITARQDYHSISIDSFFHNPLFGGMQSGGHSSLMDRLGGMGLVVGIPFIMIFISFIKTIKPLFKTRTAKTFFGVGLSLALVYLYNKGNWGCESWLFFMVLMPIGLLVVENVVTQNHHM